jgi:hypothetical protein
LVFGLVTGDDVDSSSVTGVIVLVTEDTVVPGPVAAFVDDVVDAGTVFVEEVEDATVEAPSRCRVSGVAIASRVLEEGTCRKEGKNLPPPCLCDGIDVLLLEACDTSGEGILTLRGLGDPKTWGEDAGLGDADVARPDDLDTSAESFSLVSPGGSAGPSSKRTSVTSCEGGVGGRRPKDCRSISTA